MEKGQNMMKIKKHVTLTAVVLSAIILAAGCSADSNNSATSTTSVTPETTPAVTTTAKPASQTTVTTTTTKKQETNKPVETTTTTTTTTTTKPAPEWTEEKVSATKYINTDCYSRKKAVLGAETVKIYNVNDKVKVVAKTNTGYFKLDTGAFVHGDYLSDNKVTVQTTTTTAKKPTENKPVTNTNECIEIYALDASGHNDAWTYSDMECTDAVSGYLTGTKIIAVKTYKDKGLYLIEDGLYARMSDFTTTPFVVEKWFNTATFDKKKVRQFIIDIAVKDFGLVLNEEMTIDNSSWFAPSCFPLSDDDGQVVKVRCMTTPKTVYNMGHMKKGDSFNVIIKYVDAEEMNTLGGVGEGYAIFYLR
jgi:hypothetical protein